MPHERLARMRESFEKNRSVLAEDYKYFTTPDKTANKQRAEQPEQRPRKCHPTR